MDNVSDVIGAAASGFSPLSAVLNLGKDLIDRFIPDPAAKLAASQHLLDVQAELQLEQMKADENNVSAASQNIQHDGLAGVRRVFGYSFVGILVWNWVIVPLIGKPSVNIPMEFTVAFTTLLLGTSAMHIAQSVSAMPGDSSISVLGIKVGNKS